MDREALLTNAQAEGLLLTINPFEDRKASQSFNDFFELPIYRAYVRGVQTRVLPEGYIEDLAAPQELDLLREPDNRRDRKSTAVYHEGQKLGYLPKEDNLMLGKLVRRGLPVSCRLIGVQPDEESYHQLSIEVSLLYPPHPTTDTAIEKAEDDRIEGLQYVKQKPSHKLYESGDPLSMHHVWPGFFE